MILDNDNATANSAVDYSPLLDDEPVNRESFSVRQRFELLYALSKRARSKNTTSSVTQPTSKCSKPSVVKNGPPSRTSKVSSTQIQQVIQDFFSKHNKPPTTKWIRENLGCGGQRVNDELARFKRDLNRDERQTAYIGYLVNTPDTRRFIDANQRTINTAFRRIRQNLDNAQFALYNSHPNDLALLTLNVPSDTELTFLATCELAEQIPVRTIERLLTKKVAASARYVWRWEIQPENRRRLHLHLLLYVPPDAKKYVTTYPVEQAWFHTLEHLLDEESGCDPLRSEHGADLRGSKHLVHVQFPYKELTEEKQYKFDWGYIAAEFKKGKPVLAVRRLYDELPRNLVVPCRHGGVSASLQKLVDEQKLSIRLPAFSEEEARRRIEEVKRIPAFERHAWKRRGKLNNIHYIRVSKQEYNEIKTVLNAFLVDLKRAHEHKSWTFDQVLEEATHKVYVTLEPNRFLKVQLRRRKDDDNR